MLKKLKDVFVNKERITDLVNEIDDEEVLNIIHDLLGLKTFKSIQEYVNNLVREGKAKVIGKGSSRMAFSLKKYPNLVIKVPLNKRGISQSREEINAWWDLYRFFKEYSEYIPEIYYATENGEIIVMKRYEKADYDKVLKCLLPNVSIKGVKKHDLLFSILVFIKDLERGGYAFSEDEMKNLIKEKRGYIYRDLTEEIIEDLAKSKFANFLYELQSYGILISDYSNPKNLGYDHNTGTCVVIDLGFTKFLEH